MTSPIPPDRDPELRRLISLDASGQAEALARMVGDDPEPTDRQRRRRPTYPPDSRIDLPIYRYAKGLPADLRLHVMFDGIDSGVWCRTDTELLFVIGGSMVLSVAGCEALYHAAKGIVAAVERDRHHASRRAVADWQRRARAGVR